MFVYRTDAVNSLEMEADKNTTKKTMNKKIKHPKLPKAHNK